MLLIITANKGIKIDENTDPQREINDSIKKLVQEVRQEMKHHQRSNDGMLKDILDKQNEMA